MATRAPDGAYKKIITIAITCKWQIKVFLWNPSLKNTNIPYRQIAHIANKLWGCFVYGGCSFINHSLFPLLNEFGKNLRSENRSDDFSFRMCGWNVDYKENILVGGVLINNAVYKPSDEWKLKKDFLSRTTGAILM